MQLYPLPCARAVIYPEWMLKFQVPSMQPFDALILDILYLLSLVLFNYLLYILHYSLHSIVSQQ
jgi:hypothetical protein